MANVVRGRSVTAPIALPPLRRRGNVGSSLPQPLSLDPLSLDPLACTRLLSQPRAQEFIRVPRTVPNHPDLNSDVLQPKPLWPLKRVSTRLLGNRWIGNFLNAVVADAGGPRAPYVRASLAPSG
jgi:hypothetical protein